MLSAVTETLVIPFLVIVRVSQSLESPHLGKLDLQLSISSSVPADNGEEHSEGGLVENHVDGNVNLMGGGGGAGRKPLKSGMKELAVFREKVTEQHRQMGKGGKHHLGLEEPKKLRPPPARVREGRVWLEGWEDGQSEGPSRRGPEHCREIHVLCACGQSSF